MPTLHQSAHSRFTIILAHCLSNSPGSTGARPRARLSVVCVRSGRQHSGTAGRTAGRPFSDSLPGAGHGVSAVRVQYGAAQRGRTLHCHERARTHTSLTQQPLRQCGVQQAHLRRGPGGECFSLCRLALTYASQATGVLCMKVGRAVSCNERRCAADKQENQHTLCKLP